MSTVERRGPNCPTINAAPAQAVKPKGKTDPVHKICSLCKVNLYIEEYVRLEWFAEDGKCIRCTEENSTHSPRANEDNSGGGSRIARKKRWRRDDQGEGRALSQDARPLPEERAKADDSRTIVDNKRKAALLGETTLPSMQLAKWVKPKKRHKIFVEASTKAEEGKGAAKAIEKRAKAAEYREKKAREKAAAQGLPYVKGRVGRKSKETMLAEEQLKFMKCEEIFLPLMQQLTWARDFSCVQGAVTAMDLIVEKVELLTPPFLRMYGLGKLVKTVRKTFQSSHPDVKDQCRSLTAEMKRVFKQKLKRVPQDFRAKKMHSLTIAAGKEKTARLQESVNSMRVDAIKANGSDVDHHGQLAREEEELQILAEEHNEPSIALHTQITELQKDLDVAMDDNARLLIKVKDLSEDLEAKKAELETLEDGKADALEQRRTTAVGTTANDRDDDLVLSFKCQEEKLRAEISTGMKTVASLLSEKARMASILEEVIVQKASLSKEVMALKSDRDALQQKEPPEEDDARSKLEEIGIDTLDGEIQSIHWNTKATEQNEASVDDLMKLDELDGAASSSIENGPQYLSDYSNGNANGQTSERYESPQDNDPPLSEVDVAKFRTMMATFFRVAKGEHIPGEMSLKDVHIVVEGEPSGSCSFLLQKFLDDLYNDPKKSPGMARCRKVLFGHTAGRGGNSVTKGLLSPWKVSYKKSEFYDFNTKKASKEQEALDTAIDEGGPSRQFKTDTWRQLSNLSIPVSAITDKKKREKVVVRIFEEVSNNDGSYAVPITDAALESRIRNAVTDDFDAIRDAIERAKDYTRAIGRIMLHSFLHGQAVSASAMTPFFINVILRGCFPGDRDYRQADVMNHMDGVLVTNPQNMVSFLLEDDSGEVPWTTETIFSDFIPSEFILSRSLLLGAFADGLTLGGKPSASSELREGCGLASILRAMPLEAVQKILFSQSAVTLDGIFCSLAPLFCEGEADWGGKEEELVSVRKQQEQFFEDDFKRYLRERKSQPSFLARFVECCTGSNYLPFLSPDGTPFEIVVEFNLFSPCAGQHPLFQTCSNTIRLPGMGLYCGDYALYCKAIESSFNRFDAQ